MVVKISVIGQGYVGLPIALAAYEAGYDVYGIDNDVHKIAVLNSYKSVVEDITDYQIKEALTSTRYHVSTDVKLVSESEIILICVPTPLLEDHTPDLRFLISN